MKYLPIIGTIVIAIVVIYFTAITVGRRLQIRLVKWRSDLLSGQPDDRKGEAMNRSGALTSKTLEKARQRMILAARQEYKENGFILFSGIRYGKSQLHKDVVKEFEKKQNEK